jgi:hypothetical protein
MLVKKNKLLFNDRSSIEENFDLSSGIYVQLPLQDGGHSVIPKMRGNIKPVMSARIEINEFQTKSSQSRCLHCDVALID